MPLRGYMLLDNPNPNPNPDPDPNPNPNPHPNQVRVLRAEGKGDALELISGHAEVRVRSLT